MSNQKRVDRIVSGQRCLHQRKGEFLDWIWRQCKSRYIWGDDGENSKEKGQHVENNKRQEQCWYEVGRGDWGRQSEVDTKASKNVVEMTSIEGQRCVVNGGEELGLGQLIRCWIGSQWSEFRAEVVLVVEQVTTPAKEFLRRWRQWILQEEMPVRMELT